MSNINPYNINGNFPIANQDNPSQGFRDNFTNTKNNFIYAQSEITDLQAKAITTSALNGQPLNNNMNGTVLTAPQLSAWTQKFIDHQTVSNTVSFDFTQGNFHKATLANNISINIVNWPASQGIGSLGYGVMRTWFVTTAANQTVSLPANVNISATSLSNYNNNVLTFDVPGNYIFDFSSIDGGQNYMIQDLTRNRAWFVDPYFYYNPTVVAPLLVGYGSLLPVAIATEQSASDAISAKGSFSSYNSVQYYNSPGFGDGDSSYAGGSNVHLPGFGTIVSRSYMDPVLGLQEKAANVNDALGYFNASFAAGSPGLLGNVTFNEAGAIRFYATSALPTSITSLPDGLGGLQSNYSPGGNIQIWTKQDYGLFGQQTLGYAGWPRADSVNYNGVGGVLGKAMTIENDQSVKMWAATAKNYQFANLSSIVGAVNANISPYISTVILDSTNGTTIAAANLQLPPSFALQDGQELNISSNCAITTLKIVPYVGQVSIPVVKTYANAVSADGVNVTYYFDNSGNYFPSGGYFQATGYQYNAGFNTGNSLIVSSNATSITTNLGTVTPGYDPTGSVITTAYFIGNTKIANAPTTVTAGSSIKLMYVAQNKQWYRV